MEVEGRRNNRDTWILNKVTHSAIIGTDPWDQGLVQTGDGGGSMDQGAGEDVLYRLF